MKRSTRGKAKTKCFVIMPFSDTLHGGSKATSSSQWNHIYDRWIKRAVESFKNEVIACSRSLAIPGNFVKGIISDLSEADLVIADITGNKPNVFYELGIRHALKTGTILISQDLGAVPSDLKSYYTFGYNYTDKAHEYEDYFNKFEKELHAKIEAFLSGSVLTDSPVSDFLGFRFEIYRKQMESDRAELHRLVVECGHALEENYNVFEFLLSAVSDSTPISLERFPVIDTVAIDSLYRHLLGLRTELFGEKLTSSLRSILASQRHSLLMVKHHWDSFFLIPDSDKCEALVFLLDHLVRNEKPKFLKSWPGIVDAISKIEAIIVVKNGRQSKKIPMPRKHI